MIEIQYLTVRQDLPGRVVDVQIVTDLGALEGELHATTLSVSGGAIATSALALIEAVRAAAETRYAQVVTVRTTPA